MIDERLIKKLCALAQLDIDAIGAYEKAIEHIDVAEVRQHLSEFKADHQQHVEELNKCILELGGEPPKPTPDLKGVMLSAFTSVRSITGTQGALKAMQTNEELTNKTYQEALEEIGLPEDIRLLLLKNRDDERRHLQYIVSCVEQQAKAA